MGKSETEGDATGVLDYEEFISVRVCVCVCVYGAGSGTKGIPGRGKRLLMPETNNADADSIGISNIIKRTSTNHGLHTFNSTNSC